MLLAIDTSTRMTSIALATDTQVLAEYSWHSHQQHTTQLGPAVSRLFTDVNVEMSALRAVAVAVGPGSFTGVRIGMALAKGIALAQNVQIHPIPTLNLVAASSPVTPDKTLVTIIPAGRGRVLAQTYEANGQIWQPLDAVDLYTWANLLEYVPHNALFAGEIDDKGLAAITDSVHSVELLPVSQRIRRASFMLRLCDRFPAQSPETIQPIYIKEP